MPALQTLSALGLAGVASYALARTLVRFRAFRFYRYALVAVDVTRLPVMPRGLHVRAVSASELADHRIDAPVEVQASRFAQGMTCLGAFSARGVLLGVTWVTASDPVEDDVAVRFLLPPDACWDTGLWIDPRYRLSRAFSALWAGTREWMAASGLTTSYSRIADYNLASSAAHRRLGANFIRYQTVLGIGQWRLSISTRPRLWRPATGAATIAIRPTDRRVEPDTAHRPGA